MVHVLGSLQSLAVTLSDDGWGPRDDKIVQFASHYFLYFPIFHLKYSYIFPIFFLYFFLQNSYIPIFLSKKSLGALRLFHTHTLPPERHGRQELPDESAAPAAKSYEAHDKYR